MPGIHVYDEADLAAAQRVLGRECPTGTLLLREIAGEVAQAREEGRQAAREEIAARLEELLPAFGIRAGREIRSLAAELRLK